MPEKFKVTVQYRSQRTITVTASDRAEAVEKASKRFDESGHEVIACCVEANHASKELTRILDENQKAGEKYLREWWAVFLAASALGEQSE